MSVIEIESELRRMNNVERLYVIEIATKYLKAEITPTLETNKSLRRSAEIMREEYLNNKNLTYLCELDGEDFQDV
ncbi:MAG: hypothetical protein M3T96_06290 [Acidobacteriota bacterium]|nr:hypothetical protein [Acidobacteriota bacterium]